MPSQTPPTESDPVARSQGGVVKKYLAWGLLCGAVGGFSSRGISAQDKAEKKEPSAQTSTSVIELKPARLYFVDRHEVAFDRPGVLQLVLEEGENVEKGQIVARLVDGIALAAVGVAEARVMNTAEVESARKQAELAKAKLDAAEGANAKYREDQKKQATGSGSEGTANQSPANGFTKSPGLVNESPMDGGVFNRVTIQELLLTYQAAEADIGRFEKEHEVNQQGLLQAQAELEVLVLKAPRDGLITRAFKQTGEGTQSGEKVLEIISTQRIRAEVEVDAVIAARLKVGMPVTVVVHQPSGANDMDLERYPTVLKFIDPSIGQLSKKVRIWAELDNTPGKLREGLTASIEFIPGMTAPVTLPQ